MSHVFSTLDLALCSAYQRSCPCRPDGAVENWCVYAFDAPPGPTTSKGAKRYTVELASWTPPGDQHAYELVRDVDLRRLPFDMEWYPATLCDERYAGAQGERTSVMLDDFEECVRVFIRTHDPRWTRIVFSRLTSSAVIDKPTSPAHGMLRESFHLVARLYMDDGETEGVLRDGDDWKTWSAAFQRTYEAEQGTRFKFRNPETEARPLKDIYDKGIMKYNQCFRMMGQSKRGSNGRILKPARPGTPEDERPENHRVIIPRVGADVRYVRMPAWHAADVPGDEETTAAEPVAADDDTERIRAMCEVAPAVQEFLMTVERRRFARLKPAERTNDRPTYRQMAFVSATGRWRKAGLFLRADDGPRHLERLIEQQRPHAIHAGPWLVDHYKTAAVRWRELTFDIDIPEIPAAQRRCACRGEKRCCTQCWTTFAESGMLYLRHVLWACFGWRDVRFFFSGRKGWHAWVLDATEAAVVRNPQVRTWLYEELCMPRGIPDLKARRHDIWTALYSCVRPRWAEHKRDRLPAEPTSVEAATPDEELAACIPIMDAPVTTDLKHCMKVPLMPHPVTGALAAEIPFDPNVSSIDIPVGYSLQFIRLG